MSATAIQRCKQSVDDSHPHTVPQPQQAKLCVRHKQVRSTSLWQSSYAGNGAVLIGWASLLKSTIDGLNSKTAWWGEGGQRHRKSTELFDPPSCRGR